MKGIARTQPSCNGREALAFAPTGGRVPETEEPTGHRAGSLAPRMASRTPYVDASLDGKDGQRYGDPIHVTTQPLSANSIAAARIMPENLQVKQPSSYP